MIMVFKGSDRSETQYQTPITKGCDRSRLGVPRRVAVWSTPIAFGNLVSPNEWRRSNSRLYLIQRFADVETLGKIVINLDG